MEAISLTIYTALLEASAVIGAALAAAYGIYQKWVKPWAQDIKEKATSTNDAVNHGWSMRVTKSLERGAERMDRIEHRADHNAEATHDRLEGLCTRIDGLEEGQRQMLALLRKKEEQNGN